MWCVNMGLKSLGNSVGFNSQVWAEQHLGSVLCQRGLWPLDLCLGLRRCFSCWGLQKTPNEQTKNPNHLSPWSFLEEQMKEESSLWSSPCCRGTGENPWGEKGMPSTGLFLPDVFRGSGWFSVNVLVWGLTLPASLCLQTFHYKQAPINSWQWYPPQALGLQGSLVTLDWTGFENRSLRWRANTSNQ